MSVETTRRVVAEFVNSGHQAVHLLTDDVIFHFLPKRRDFLGPSGVDEMRFYLFHEAFDAVFEIENTVVQEENAAVEGMLIGRHAGNFFGIPATNSEIRVPMCEFFELEGEKIREARVYLELTVFFEQIGLAVGTFGMRAV